MKTIVDEAGEVIAKATDDHTLVGGHHRLAVAASLGKKLFWRDTGEPVKLDNFLVLFDIQPEPLAERMAHVERSGANLHRGGRHRGRAAAGLSVDRHRRGVERAAVRLIR